MTGAGAGAGVGSDDGLGAGCLTTGLGGGASLTFTGASLLAICEWNRSRTSRISFITLMSCESSSG